MQHAHYVVDTGNNLIGINGSFFGWGECLISTNFVRNKIGKKFMSPSTPVASLKTRACSFNLTTGERLRVLHDDDGMASWLAHHYAGSSR